MNYYVKNYSTSIVLAEMELDSQEFYTSRCYCVMFLVGHKLHGVSQIWFLLGKGAPQRL